MLSAELRIGTHSLHLTLSVKLLDTIG